MKIINKHKRLVQTSVTCFLYHGNEYLFILRDNIKSIDPNRINGIGGRVEPGENYLEAALREIKEETGYVTKEKDIQIVGIVRLEGGYTEDWVMCFFKVYVSTKTIPLGNKTKDGELLWIHKNDVLNSKHELVDDLYYIFNDIVKGEKIIFMNAQLNKQEKIYNTSINKLNNLYATKG